MTAYGELCGCKFKYFNRGILATSEELNMQLIVDGEKRTQQLGFLLEKSGINLAHNHNFFFLV